MSVCLSLAMLVNSAMSVANTIIFVRCSILLISEKKLKYFRYLIW